MMTPMQKINNILVMKNHLSKISESKLCDLYKDYDYYLAFLNSIWLVIENEGAFLLFDKSFIEKVLSVIQIHRFDAKDEGVKKEVNDIIDYMNFLKTIPKEKKVVLMNNYLAFQEEKRGATFYSTKGLIDSMAYDANVLVSLQSGDMSHIAYDEHYLLSLNYLLYACSELFYNEEVRDRALKRLDIAYKNARLLSPVKKLINQTKKHIKEIKQKEE